MYVNFRTFRKRLILLAAVVVVLVLSPGQVIFADSASVSVTIAVTECSDGIDNDGDGLIDYPNDPDCDSLSDDDESSPPAPPPPASGDDDNSGSGTSGASRQQITDTRPPITSISFSGSAYPGARVVVLRNGFSYLSKETDSSGRFFIEDKKAVAGTYTFSVKAHDTSGRESAPITFSIIIPKGRAVFVEDIIIPPTIGISSPNISSTGAVTISGETLPGVSMEIFVAENKYTTRSDSLGVYRQSISPNLSNGFYVVRARPLLGDGIDRFSAALSLRIGDTAGIFNPSEVPKWDLDGNGRVDLIDFSILAFWYRKGNPPASVDLNGDGVVDLQDMSVLAYYWTG